MPIGSLRAGSTNTGPRVDAFGTAAISFDLSPDRLIAMVILAATIARRRVYYPRPVESLPDILMIELPQRFARRRQALKRFYPILIETVEEQSELETFLAQPRDKLVMPDLLNRRRSDFSKEHLTVAHYAPSEAGWPFVLLCQWPAEFAARVSSEDRLFMRGIYTFELFPDRNQLEEASKVLLKSLDREREPHVEIVFPDWSADPDAPPH
ncbi:MAG: hypothetical protein ACJ8FN_12230 [Sphingomicrobium sp.]